MTKERKTVVAPAFRRESERRSFEIRPQSTTTTSGIRNAERKGSLSTPGSRHSRNISWVDYEDLIKARQDDRHIETPASIRSPLSRSPSPVSRAVSRGRSPGSKREQQLEEADGEGEDIRRSVRFSASVPVQPRESLPFPFLRRTSSVNLPGAQRILPKMLSSPFKDYHSLLLGQVKDGEGHRARTPWSEGSTLKVSCILRKGVRSLQPHGFREILIGEMQHGNRHPSLKSFVWKL